MCVIMLAEDKRPTENMIERAWARNDDGAGIAWREINPDTKQPEVHWKKGLHLAEIQKLAAEVPTPYILHFRIASVGGAIPQLTHPFPIDTQGRNYMSGKTSGYVLFHNGHYNDWKKDMKEAALRYGKKIPDGKWSDTRAMAWICSMAGINYMEMIEEKGIAFSPKNIEMYWGAGWYLIGDVWCSNSYWTNTTPKAKNNADPTGAYGYGPGPTAVNRDLVYDNTKYTICIAPHCHEKEYLDEIGYCPKHTKKRPQFADDDLPVLQGNRKINTTPLPNEEEDVQAGGTESDDPFVRWEVANQNFVSRKIGTKQWKRARREIELHLMSIGRDKEVSALYIKPQRDPQETGV